MRAFCYQRSERNTMRIQKIVRQHRRDFWAIFECEHCLNVYEQAGYDDEYFHRIVVPKMACPRCGKTADLNTYRPLNTRYPDGEQH